MKPKVSIAIPVYNMPNKDFFLDRCLASIRSQSFQDYEIVITEKGKMAENTNAAIKASKGEIIKILYMDDYLAHKHALKEIVEAFDKDTQWLATGCVHDNGKRNDLNPHLSYYNANIRNGENTIGSPSVLAIRNDKPLLFDENLGWLLDCDYYYRMCQKHGLPKLLNTMNVAIGIGDHQATNLMGDEVKLKEHEYMSEKYD